uniref:Uncharacterized protein n=1 Tax=Myoviridae sp. ctbEa13 TaxID=2825136 RepID=A0A8S5VBE7_9CAUD|nr:MAG TPA: hypothetical protein [Myoviridae sp. ctbEa13]
MRTQVKKYFVKHNYRFNLDSMLTHVMNMIDDMRDGSYDEVELMGEKMDYDRLIEFRDEVEDLLMKSYYPVCGKDYGRIKAISDARNMIRYATCMANGMNEREAALAFFD